jgi:ribonucleoside-diphosphate reductase beta chain
MAAPQAAAQAAQTQSAPAAGGMETRRVNVADKRVINAKTDVNQLVPFKI